MPLPDRIRNLYNACQQDYTLDNIENFWREYLEYILPGQYWPVITRMGANTSVLRIHSSFTGQSFMTGVLQAPGTGDVRARAEAMCRNELARFSPNTRVNFLVLSLRATVYETGGFNNQTWIDRQYTDPIHHHQHQHLKWRLLAIMNTLQAQ